MIKTDVTDFNERVHTNYLQKVNKEIRIMKYYLLIFTCFMTFVFANESIYKDTLLFPYLKPFSYEEVNTGLDKIDRVYVINLDRRFYKWEDTAYCLQSNGYNPIRFPAVDGWQISDETIKELKLPSSSLGHGQVGCFLSHLSILHDAYQKNYKAIWILEDDIEFLEEIDIDAFVEKLTNLDPEWDILYTDIDTKHPFFYNQIMWIYNRPFIVYPRPEQKKKDYETYFERTKIDEDFTRIHLRYGGYSMLISKRGIKKILDYCLDQKLYTPYDCDIHFIPGIRQYITNKDYVSVIPGWASDTKRFTP